MDWVHITYIFVISMLGNLARHSLGHVIEHYLAMGNTNIKYIYWKLVKVKNNKMRKPTFVLIKNTLIFASR